MNATEFLATLASNGRYHFTLGEAQKALERSPVATRAAIRRLKQKGMVAVPLRGFHLIVPPEYRRLGCLPPDQFVPQLMAHLGEAYYVGLLSAAEYHGAAHQKPQQFQVVTETSRPDVRCGRALVVFVARRNVRDIPTVSRNTLRDVMLISTPEATALDLVGRPRRSGGLDNVATVLTELAEELDPDRLAKVAENTAPLPWAQRLGYLLDLVDASDCTAPLASYVARTATHVTPLAPHRPMRGVPRAARWRVAVNVEVEPDL